jgi:hypothetical protein
MQISNDRDEENTARLQEQTSEIVFKADPNGAAPTFVARFSDGIVTKMTCYCARGKLDLRRGIVLSRAAYESRAKGKEPPPLVEARFQTREGEILCEYDNKAIADVEGKLGQVRAPK